MRRLCALASAVLLGVSIRTTEAQEPAVPLPASLAVFLDCRTRCDSDLLRTEIAWVNWVRDREVADVHILVTSQQAGAGGEQYTLAFLGLRAFVGRGDTLKLTTNPTMTFDESRRMVLQTISVGLVPYAARTAMAPKLRITAPSDEKQETQAALKSDPWNAWVFEVGFRGTMAGEHSYKGRNVNGALEARRVTERWKTNMEYNYSYNDNQATVQEFDSTGKVTSEETYSNLQRNWNFEWLQVKSMTDHFSLGAELAMAQQTYRNQDLRSQLQAAFEYNLFPYSQSTRRELSFRYGIGYSSFKYTDTTIFGKISETLPSHFAELSYNTRQPWGNVNVNLEHRNFLTDASKRTSSIGANFNVRLFKGFNLTGGGGYEWINDQIYLPAESSNAVDVFLRRRALLTSFSYETHFGISYTFGSIFNNVVNPRF